jgi:cytosine/adenosine deaminase-related metal-dependent hydrolase
MRLGALLHAVPGFSDSTHRGQMLRAATAHGRASLGLAGTGRIAEGEAADWITLDLDRLDRDGILRVEPQDLLFARDEVVVAGKTIVQRGKLVSLDLDQVQEDLRDQFRRALSERADFSAAWPDIESAVTQYYHERAGCC